jgi:hypothetical protein
MNADSTLGIWGIRRKNPFSNRRSQNKRNDYWYRQVYNRFEAVTPAHV